ncbi:Polysaccharide pyruvyl transferase [compost metagenome]
MKIGLITIHHANSYGGTLQALATQEILKEYGEVKIIDYKNNELKKTLFVVRAGRKPRDVLRMAKDIARLIPRSRLVKKFKTFISENYDLTTECKNSQELRELGEKFDILVCGSDQIWNPKILGEFDANYMLGFAKGPKKVSLSSSAGSYVYPPQEQAKVRDLLADFACISVRESDTAQRLKEITRRSDISNTIDPTLMLTKEQWLNLIDPTKTIVSGAERYALTYTLKKNRHTKNIIKQISESLGVKIIAIDQDPYLGYPAHAHIMDACPAEYISLFANASFVITNSFHGTAFSTNFKIPFITIEPESGANRVSGLLKALGLEERFISENSDLERIIKTMPDFEKAHDALNKLRQTTRNYIKNSIHV